MESFFIHVLKGSEITPPDNVYNAFIKNFANAINIEWQLNNNLYEAVFYKDNYEYIALFSRSLI